MTRLFVCRHANTFDPGDTVLRVGARTDLPLSQSGQAQAEELGRVLGREGVAFDAAFISPLKRTRQTAEIVLATLGCEVDLQMQPFLREIDYGPDDGQPEDVVRERLGPALEAWEARAVPPPGWRVDPVAVAGSWAGFLDRIAKRHQGETVLAVTSGGVARFLPNAVRGEDALARAKLKTASFAELAFNDGWRVMRWGDRA
ncbi:MAG: histidine phosphatase family protein [Pseudomonadota bacterium]